MPRALAVAWDLIRSDEPAAKKKATLLAFDQVFGLGIAEWSPARLDIPRDIIQLAEDRETARKNRDWKRADELRDAITEAGFQLEDTREGFRIRKV